MSAVTPPAAETTETNAAPAVTPPAAEVGESAPVSAKEEKSVADVIPLEGSETAEEAPTPAETAAGQGAAATPEAGPDKKPVSAEESTAAAPKPEASRVEESAVAPVENPAVTAGPSEVSATKATSVEEPLTEVATTEKSQVTAAEKPTVTEVTAAEKPTVTEVAAVEKASKGEAAPRARRARAAKSAAASSGERSKAAPRESVQHVQEELIPQEQAPAATVWKEPASPVQESASGVQEDAAAQRSEPAASEQKAAIPAPEVTAPAQEVTAPAQEMAAPERDPAAPEHEVAASAKEVATTAAVRGEAVNKAARTDPWAGLIADPARAPELLAIAAVQTLGPRAQEWAARTREAYPTAGTDALVRLATRQFTRFGSLTGIVGAVAGSYAPVALLGAAALTDAELALHIAAAHGLDPTDEERAADLLVIGRVHATKGDAIDALVEARRPAYDSKEPLWRLAGFMAAQTAAWVAVKAVNRRFPGTSLLAAFLSNTASANATAARAAKYYKSLKSS
ncbi:hypothetical protein ACQPZJ_50440 [Actinoplanes sp. CA-054009]